MDYKILEIARTYSVDTETLIENYNRIIEGLNPLNKYTADDLASFAIYVFRTESIKQINIERFLEDWLKCKSKNDK